MAKIPLVAGRRINKRLCLCFSAMAVLFLLAAAVCAVSVESVFAQVMCMIAAIWAGFAAVYGIGWLVYARREAKRQKKIERAAELLREESSNQLAYAEFTLPKDELAAGAKKRFAKFAAALLCIALTVFAVLYVIILLSAGWGGFVHLLGVLGFCFLITVPGTLVQYGIYKKYVSDLPEKIILFPGKLIIDGRQLAAREIQSISISSYKTANRNSAAVYRKLKIESGGKRFEYTVDFRTAGDGNPRWAEYGQLLEEMKNWAEQNRVRLKVDYMD